MPADHFLRAVGAARGAAAALVIAGTGAVVATSMEYARDSAERRRGLLGRDGLAQGTAFVIAPCSAVHTFGMRFAIDVIFADRDGRVLKISTDLRPGRMAAAWRAFAAIEMAAGQAGRDLVKVGDILEVRI